MTGVKVPSVLLIEKKKEKTILESSFREFSSPSLLINNHPWLVVENSAKTPLGRLLFLERGKRLGARFGRLHSARKNHRERAQNATWAFSTALIFIECPSLQLVDNIYIYMFVLNKKSTIVQRTILEIWKKILIYCCVVRRINEKLKGMIFLFTSND